MVETSCELVLITRVRVRTPLTQTLSRPMHRRVENVYCTVDIPLAHYFKIVKCKFENFLQVFISRLNDCPSDATFSSPDIMGVMGRKQTGQAVFWQLSVLGQIDSVTGSGRANADGGNEARATYY